MIFLSYSSKDRDLTRALAKAIEGQYGAGSVWWDHALESWGDYEVQIRIALNQARVVVVLWTPAAAASDWVKAEAGRANHAHRLVNVRAPGTSWQDVPSPYDQHHFKELSDTPGILHSIDAVWTGRAIRTALPLDEIYFRQHGQRIIDPKQSVLPRGTTDVSPIELLQARFEMVGYVDVTGAQTRLLDWCTEVHRSANAGRLIHGPGGLGKTRLLISVAATLRMQGWTAGFLTPPGAVADAATIKQRRQALEQRLAHGEDQGVLLVVDYAEGRQAEVKVLAELVSQRTADESRPMRVVLLVRSAGDWWSRLHDESLDMQRLFRGVGTEDVRPELPFVTQAEDRRAMFTASLTAFGPVLEAQGVRQPARTPPPDLFAQIENGPGYDRPLAIQMAALVWLTSARSAGATSDVAALLRAVLGLEQSHWQKLLGALDEERMRDLARGAAQVTAVQGTASAESTDRLLMADVFYKGRRTARVDVDRVRRDLVRVYGRDDGGIMPLEPDLIGEHHVASVSDVELIEGCLRWIDEDLPERQARRHRDVLTILQRATHADHGPTIATHAAALLDHLVVTHAATVAAPMVDVIIGTPGRLADVLESRVADLDATALGAVEDALPWRSVSLLDVSMKIAARRVNLARDALSTSDDRTAKVINWANRQLAAWLRIQRIRLSNLERREEALARSLTNLGTQLSNLGRHKEALAAGEEAVAIYRRLANGHPDAILPNLPGSLTSLGNRLSNLGRHEEALAAAQEAVAIYRRLADARPDAFAPVLARSLSVVSNIFASLGRSGEAARAAHHALETLAPFVERHPEASGELARDIMRGVRTNSEAACEEPDAALLTRIANALGGSSPDAHD